MDILQEFEEFLKNPQNPNSVIHKRSPRGETKARAVVFITLRPIIIATVATQDAWDFLSAVRKRELLLGRIREIEHWV